MNIKQTIAALVLAGSCLTLTANAQKAYTEGIATYDLTTSIGAMQAKVLFRPDSNAFITQQGPANIKAVSNTKGTYAVVLVDVPIASIKKAAILTPDEIEQGEAKAPKFTFTTTAETKQINGYNCKKVIAKDAASGSSTEIWVTTDITAPKNTLTKYFEAAGGFPVQFSTSQQGQTVGVTLKSITQEKLPAGSFGIPAGYDRITLDDLSKLGGR